MALRDVLLRTFFLPVWVPGPPKVEAWTCPTCGRDLQRVSPAQKGIWFTAGPDELLALCARTHGVHDRKGRPLAVDEDALAVAEAEDWIPIVAVDAAPGGDAPPDSFVALVPPHGVAFVLDGTGYRLRRLRDLSPSDLVGPRAASLEGDVIGRVDVADVEFDGLRAVRVVAELGLAVGDAPAADALQRRERTAPV